MCGSSPPPTPEPVEAAPQRNDEEIKNKAAGARKRRALANGGRQTIATGGLGDPTEANVTKGAVVLGGAI